MLTDAQVPELWQRLGLPGLADIHVHFLPAPVLRKVWAYFDAAREHYGTDWAITYRQGESQRLDRLRAMGVRRFPALVYPHKPGMAAWLSDWALNFAAGHPDVAPTATFYPEEGAQEQVRTCLDRGAQVFKAHLQVGDYDPRDPLLRGVWGQLAEAGVPVVTHCGSGPRPGRFTGPGPIGAVLAEHPRLRLVIAHMGMPDYAGMLDLTERYGRVHLDTTIAFTDFAERQAPFPPELLPRLVALTDRIVLGSDFPNIPHTYAHQLEALVRLGLGEDWLRAVLWDNGARLLGLTEPSASHRSPDHSSGQGMGTRYTGQILNEGVNGFDFGC